MSPLHRAQILLEAEQHQALARMAKGEGRSISELVREIVRRYLAAEERERRAQRELKAIETLTQMRLQLQAQHGIYQGDLLAEARSERDRELEGAQREAP